MNYVSELRRFLKNNEDVYDKDVITYGEDFVKRIKSNSIIKEFFKNNNIGIYSFLNELLNISQNKFNIIGSYQLDENEINHVFGKVILNNEILILLLNDKILINGLNKQGELVYELTNESYEYFNIKYGIKMSRVFSMRDIIILTIDNSNNYLNQ